MKNKVKITDYRYEIRNMPDENIAILYLFNGNDIVCMSVFHDNNEEELPPPSEGLNGIVYKACHFSWFQNIVDMLRFEAPVYFSWNASEQVASISTENEDVAEEERTSLIRYFFG